MPLEVIIDRCYQDLFRSPDRQIDLEGWLRGEPSEWSPSFLCQPCWHQPRCVFVRRVVRFYVNLTSSCSLPPLPLPLGSSTALICAHCAWLKHLCKQPQEPRLKCVRLLSPSHTDCRRSSDILCISPDILSDMFSAISSDILSHSFWHLFLAFFLTFLKSLLASLLTFLRASLLTLFPAFCLASLLTFFLASLLTFCMRFFAYVLGFCLAFFLAYLLTFCPIGICSGILSDRLSDISSGMLSGILFDILSGALSGNLLPRVQTHMDTLKIPWVQKRSPKWWFFFQNYRSLFETRIVFWDSWTLQFLLVGDNWLTFLQKSSDIHLPFCNIVQHIFLNMFVYHSCWAVSCANFPQVWGIKSPCFLRVKNPWTAELSWICSRLLETVRLGNFQRCSLDPLGFKIG